MYRYLKLVENKIKNINYQQIKKVFPTIFNQDKPVLMHRWKLYEENKNDDTQTSNFKKQKFDFDKVDKANEDHCGICSNDPDSIFNKK